MGILNGHLVRTAFLTKYGYSPDLTYDEMLCEFQRRYDRAQILRQENAGSHTIMLIIEGMAENVDENEAFWEREIRKRKIRRLCDENGLSALDLELDLLAEEYIACLELRWIYGGECQRRAEPARTGTKAPYLAARSRG